MWHDQIHKVRVGDIVKIENAHSNDQNELNIGKIMVLGRF
jgi:ssDNA-binding replication factor A large subunit